MSYVDIAGLRKAVRERRYRFTTHAAQRIGERNISILEVIAVIEAGEVVEEHPEDQPHPKVLLMGRIKGVPMYVSCAFDGRHAHIITVHWYDENKWIDPWTRRN